MLTIQELLYTEFDGTPADPDDVIADAFDSSRYLERVPPLKAILADADADPSDRFIACYALTAWAEESGYHAVIDAARHPAATAWLGTTIDRMYSVDDSFALLSNALRTSAKLSSEKETEDLRVEAIRCVLALLPDWYLGRELADALEGALAALRADARAAVERGIARLSEGPRPSFALEIQVAAVIGMIVLLDEPEAVYLADRMLEGTTSVATMRELSDVVGRGEGQASLALGERLTMIGDESVRREVDAAVRRRHRARGADGQAGVR